MAEKTFLTTPPRISGMPGSIAYIIGNEAAERFCFYGLKTILFIFMTQKLLGLNGELQVMSEPEARSYFHMFIFAVYFLPLFGAILSDAFLGKYRTIFYISLVYSVGSLVLAYYPTRTGLLFGLTLIAIGSGGIKPCVSANVGDQFGSQNQHLLPKVFGWFYLSVNAGSTFSSLLTPWLLDTYGAGWAFGIPAIFMWLATLVFWLGRYQYVHVPPAGWNFVKETFSRDSLRQIRQLIPIYLCIMVFFSLWDQTGSAWIEQAEKMNRKILGIELKSSQVMAINPILILAFIPLFTYVLYPAMDKFFKLTALRKISIGLFLTVPTFLIPAWLQVQIDAGHQPTILWQIFNYVILSAAEIMVSVTCLEFSYTQAPKKLKSLIMSMYLLSIAFGNLLTSSINQLIKTPSVAVQLAGYRYYLFFAGLMLLTAFIFIAVAWFYREKSYLQEEVLG